MKNTIHNIPGRITLTIYAAITIISGCQKTDLKPAEPKPRADFTFNIANAGLLPSSVSFTNKSEHSNTNQWDFGNGNTSTEANPTVTFTAAGTYKVKLRISGQYGSDSTTKDVLITFDKPKPDFTFNIRNQGVLPDTVDFTSTSTGTVSLRWDFGNGKSDTGSRPRHVYTTHGNFNVKLVATNAAGSDSVTKQVQIQLNKPIANFNFNIRNQGFLPDTVDFTSTSTGTASLRWDFGNGKTDTGSRPRHIYTTHGNFNVKLVATNAAGSDSMTKVVLIQLNKPVVKFNYAVSNTELLPVNLTTQNATTGSNVSYRWTMGNTTSTQPVLNTSISNGGIYTLKLVATNVAGSDSATETIRISPFPHSYKSFEGTTLNLYAWEGSKMTILSRNANLNRATMFKWVKALDLAYDYYKKSTGKDPVLYAPNYYIYGRATIADVPSTCGAGCGYLGWTGIEIQHSYFDIGYNSININNQFDQVLFYELGRNFWHYGNQLAYKSNDPAATGFAIFMRFLSMDAAGVEGAPFIYWTFPVFRANVENLVSQYLANSSLNWSNTLGIGQGVPGSGLGAADLFASFCFRLMRDHGGQPFIEKFWTRAGQLPIAGTTQQAVDNFFLATCHAANKNLTTVFQNWRWPLSANALTAAQQYP